MTQVFKLPFGITVTRSELGPATIQSNLRREFLLADRPEEAFTPEDKAAEGFIDGVESLLLALASEGIDLNQPAVARAVETAVEAYANHAD